MNVLSVIHGDNARSGTFGDVVREAGHEHDEWSLAWGRPLGRPLDSYDAVLVFGGAMHADQDDRHPWLREENLFLQRLLDLGLPVLGVCLGAQLIAKAAHSNVRPAGEPEIGWFEVELTDEGRNDPLFGTLPERFDAFEWHYYTYDIPAGGHELARTRACTQAFRLGERAWGVQFHPEVTLSQIEGWVAEEAKGHRPPAELLDETRRRIGEWEELGRRLCGSFLEVAGRVASTS